MAPTATRLRGGSLHLFQRPTGCRGRYDYNSSQELADTQDGLDGDAGLSKDDDDDMENVQHDTDDDEHVKVRVGGKKGKDAPDVPPPEKVKEHTAARGEGVLPSKRGRAPEDVGQGSPGKRSRTDPVAARRRFDFNFSFLLCLYFLEQNDPFLHLFFVKCGNEFAF